MTEVVMYVKDFCPFCVKAKTLLKRRGVENITEYNIVKEPERMREMLEKSGGQKTVPQIFIGGKHVGGSDDLHALDEAGELKALLASSS